MTTRNPDYSGAFGCAWKIDLNKARTDNNVHKDDDCTVGVWLIHAPQSHPYWPWLRLSLVHLRPHPKLADPLIYVVGATHEIVVQALSPDCYPPSPDEFPFKVLTPSNFAAQLICPSDEAAYKTVETQAIEAIVNGHLNPDTDGVQQWIRIFGDHMMKK